MDEIKGQKVDCISIKRELLARSKSASLGHFVLLSLLWFFYWPSYCNSNGLISFSLLLLGAIIFRLFLTRLNDHFACRKWRRLFSVSVAGNGIGWGGIICISLQNYSEQASLFAMTLFILAGVTSGALYSLGPSKKDFLIYLSTTLGGFLLYLLSNYNQSPLFHWDVAIIALVYLMFLSKQRNIYHNEWQQLIQSKMDMKAVLDSLPGGISLVRDGKYFLVSEGVGAMVDCSVDDIVGTTIGNFNPDSVFMRNLGAFLDSSATSFSAEIPVLTRNGERVHWVIFRKLNTSGRDVVIASFDVHDLREAEKEVQLQRLKLQESAKMAALGEMSAGLAHEINNPLAVISYKVEILSQIDFQEKELIKEGLEHIKKTTQRIATIVRSLKNFAREADSDPFEEVSIQQIIDETLVFCTERFKNHGIEMKVNNILSENIECRPTLVSQVLLNLLNNAHDALEGLSEKWIEILTFDEGDFVRIQISDSGLGIPLQIRDKIMNPFFTTKGVGRGTGLGLSLSKGIVESHNGKLFFDFENKNTRVNITLPKKQGADIYNRKFSA